MLACSTGNENSQPTSLKAQYSYLVGQISKSQETQPEYCVLRVDGVTESAVREANFAGARDVVALHSKSISREFAMTLESPELRRVFGLNDDLNEQKATVSTESDLARIRKSSTGRGSDCVNSAGALRGELGLISENESMGFWSSAQKAGFCGWLAACFVSFPGVNQEWQTNWATRNPGGWTLPSYPSQRRW